VAWRRIRLGAHEGSVEGEPFDKLRRAPRLRRAISDLTLDKLILQEAARRNF
jgi:hypothetical protein